MVERSNGTEESDVVSGVINHEAKSLLMLYLAGSGEVLTKHAMSNGFREFIGPGAGWYPNPAVPYTYCEGGLESAGQVTRIIQPSGTTRSDAFRISRLGRQIGVPAAGLILDWSLEYPDISVQQVLGSTQSAGSVRAPQSRVGILSKLVEQPKAGLSMSELAGLDPLLDPLSKAYTNPLARTGTSLRALEVLGIVSIESLAEQNPRSFRVVELDPAPRFGPKRKPVGMAFHNFIQDKYKSGTPDFTFDEGVSHVLEQLDRTGAAMDPVTVRKQMMLMLSNTRRVGDGTAHYYWPGVERRETFNHGTNTKVTLNDTHRVAVQHLLEIIADVSEHDGAALRYGRRVAHDIAADPDQKLALIDKAYAFSGRARRQTGVANIAALRRVLAGRGPTDIQTAREALVGLDGRPRTIAAVRTILNKATKQGAATRAPAPTGTSRHNRRHHYEFAAS